MGQIEVVKKKSILRIADNFLLKQRERVSENKKIDAELQNDPVKDLENQMREILANQRQIFETNEFAYTTSLEHYTQAKLAQCTLIASKLDKIIKEQKEKIDALQKNKPKFLFFKKPEWNKQVNAAERRLKFLNKMKMRMTSLQNNMKDLKKIAEKKLRFENKNLAYARDAELQKKDIEKLNRESERTASQSNSKKEKRSRGRSLLRDRENS